MHYLDNSATTKIHPDVLKTYQVTSNEFFANPSSLHELGEKSKALLDQARKQIAESLGVLPEEILFTSGGTEGDNLAIKGTAFEKKDYGRHIITTAVEHPAVMETMKQLEDFGFEVTYLAVDDKGQVSPSDLKNEIRDDTILVSVMAVNNEVGAIQPIGEIGDILADYPSIHFHVDAVQAVGKTDLNFGPESRIDLAVFSSHKFHGPRGVGFLYLKKGRRIQPLLSGGGQESGMRGGTENTPAITAMAKAFRLSLEGQEDKTSKLVEQRDRLIESLAGLDHAHLFSSQAGAPHIITLGIDGIRGEVLVHALEKDGIYVSTTSACSSRSGKEAGTLLAMNIPKAIAQTAIRISLSEHTSDESIDAFIAAFKKHYQHFKGVIHG